MASHSMEKSVAASGDLRSAVSTFWSRTATRTRVKQKQPIKNNNRDNDNNSENKMLEVAFHPWSNVDDNHTHSGHNYNVPSSPAVLTCCAPTRRQLRQPPHSTRSGQQQLCQPQGTDNSRNGARKRGKSKSLGKCARRTRRWLFYPTKKNKEPGGSADTC